MAPNSPNPDLHPLEKAQRQRTVLLRIIRRIRVRGRDCLARDGVDAENPTLFEWFLTAILPYLLIFGLFIFINAVIDNCDVNGPRPGFVAKPGERVYTGHAIVVG